jgi:hypothetical protein
MDDGARQLRMLARDLDRASAALRKEMPRALRRAATPMIKAIRDEARTVLPKGGGLNEYVAESPITTIVRTGADNTTVQIRGRRRQARPNGKQVDLPAINRGRLRHPTYGHRPWVTQQVAPGVLGRRLDRRPGCRRAGAALGDGRPPPTDRDRGLTPGRGAPCGSPSPTRRSSGSGCPS